MSINTGDPVFVIHSIEANTAYIYGYGTYNGPDTDSDIIIGSAEIVLDTGVDISDLEYLFGLPETLHEHLHGKDLVFLDPLEVRKNTIIGFDWKTSGMEFIN